MQINRFIATVFFVALATHVARAADAPPAVKLPAAKTAPAVEGTIDTSWADAAELHLAYDFTYRRPASDPATARITQDGSYLYIAFHVVTHAAVTATQHTNGSSVLSDDYVGAYLDPQGVRGYSYAFFANPIGTRYQTSSENSAYAPEWTAVAKTTAEGYDVTMRIPLSIIRSGGSHDWRMQFVRFSQATNSLDIWAYSPTATSASDPAFIGDVDGVGIAAAGVKTTSAKNPPRVQVYGLGEATSSVNGGSTSRVGADFSLPIDATASIVGTLHPDYSNVEADQQTISPTAFARQYYEVRPFFTQLSSFFNGHLSCNNCPQTLYTPAIPTFSQGYGLEGTQGRFSFAAFDALGYARTDAAQTLNYQYEDPQKVIAVDAQRVAADAYGLNDDTSSLNGGYLNQHTHFGIYTNNAFESGSLVTNNGYGQYHDGGIVYAAATTTAVAGFQNIGSQFSPIDGYVAQNNIYGYQVYAQHQFNFSPSFWLHDILFADYDARYWTRTGELSQTDQSPQINFDLKDLLSIHFFAGSNGVLTQSGQFLPFNGSGFFVGYRVNTNTPTYVTNNSGTYFNGHLDAWTYLTTLPVTRRMHLTLETDEDKYSTAFAGEQSTNQWLERTSFDWQPNKDLQFDLGIRRIIGANLPNAFQPVTYGNILDQSSACSIVQGNPYNPGCFVNAGNVSVAVHYLRNRNEFYFVYGNANNLTTQPALFFKWIRYIGAQKGQ
jgi:hypothetical protein